MTKKVAGGVLSGVLKVSGLFTSSVANSKYGKKFFNLLPGEIILASLDGFGMLIVLKLLSILLIELHTLLIFLSLYLAALLTKLQYLHEF